MEPEASSKDEDVGLITAEVIPENDECDMLKSANQTSSKKISFPVDSILNAVIQDGDVMELLRILRLNNSELDINQENHTGLTALHHAVLTNNLDSVKLLLNHGADITVQDIYGFSPLHTAAALGFLQITTILILFGADVFSLTKQSELPIDVAKDINIIRVLSNEMCLKIHTELYFRSMVKLTITKILTRLYQFICYFFRTFVFIVGTIKHKYGQYRASNTQNIQRTKLAAGKFFKLGKDDNCIEKSRKLKKDILHVKKVS